MPESRSSRAIVLRWRPYAESDKIATLLTAEFGKLTGIAKGAKNSRRRFPNSLEPLARVRVQFRRKAAATLAFLESAELLASTATLSEPLRFAYGSYVAELVDQLTADDDPAPGLYALLEEALLAIEQGPSTAAFLRGFELQLLTRAGFEPQLDHCARCGHAWEAAPAHLSLHHGTLTCARCRRPEDPAGTVNAAVLPRLAALKHLPLAACRREQLGPLAHDAAQLTGRLLALHLARPLRSLELLEQMA